MSLATVLRRAIAAALWVLARVGRVLARTGAIATSTGSVIVLMLAAGAACAVMGVQMLHGTAWALITAAAILFVLAALLLRGLSRG